MKRSLLILLVMLAALGAARADTEWVLMLDNSVSMSGPTQYSEDGKYVKDIPAQDPDRMAVIAAQVFRALMGPEDKLTILIFDSSKPGIARTLPNDPARIRALRFNQGTFMVGPLKEARQILEESTAATRILILATDGAPSPEPPSTTSITAAEARVILGLEPGPAPFEVVSLALASSKESREMMERFLAPLGRLQPIDDPTKLVAAYTDVYARSIKSRPETGRLDPGGRYEFKVGKYVTDVYVALATERKTGPFSAVLAADGKPLGPLDQGDNGCDHPPCHAYQVFKTTHDPKQSSRFTLALPQSAGPVAYGIIMRYALAAEIVSAPSRAKAGEEIDVVARLNWQGGTFNDPGFFTADGFKAELALDDVVTPMTVRDDGTFTARLKVTGGPRPAARLEARFTNQWIALRNERPLAVEEWIPLELKVAPIDFGSWTGARKESRRCIDVNLAGSLNADKVPLEATVAGLGTGYQLELASPLVIKDGKFRACLEAPGCCTAAPAGATLTVRGVDPHYHPGAVATPMSYRVAPTPFLTCWWPHIAAALAAIIFTIILIGFVKPFDFDKEEVIRLAKTEAALARAGGRRLRDLPGGKRGFYRSASIAFDGAGNPVRAVKGASIALRAAKGDPHVSIQGGLEEKDARTRKFQPVDLAKGPVDLRRGIIYRVGEFFFRVG